MMDSLKLVGMWIGVAIMVVVVGAFAFFVFAYILVVLGFLVIALILVVLFNMPLSVTKDGKKIGTWKRSTGFTPNKEV